MRKISGLILFVVAAAAVGQDTAKPDYDKMKRDWSAKLAADRKTWIEKVNDDFESDLKELDLKIDQAESEYKQALKKAKTKVQRDNAAASRDAAVSILEQRIKGKKQARQDSVKAIEKWEPATQPDKIKLDWFGKLGNGEVSADFECRVFHVFDQKSAVLTYGPFSFIVEDIDTAGLTKGGIYKPAGFWHVTGSRLVGGSNYFVLKSVK